MRPLIALVAVAISLTLGGVSCDEAGPTDVGGEVVIGMNGQGSRCYGARFEIPNGFRGARGFPKCEPIGAFAARDCTHTVSACGDALVLTSTDCLLHTDTQAWNCTGIPLTLAEIEQVGSVVCATNCGGFPEPRPPIGVCRNSIECDLVYEDTRAPRRGEAVDEPIADEDRVALLPSVRRHSQPDVAVNFSATQPLVEVEYRLEIQIDLPCPSGGCALEGFCSGSVLPGTAEGFRIPFSCDDTGQCTRSFCRSYVQFGQPLSEPSRVLACDFDDLIRSAEFDVERALSSSLEGIEDEFSVEVME